jgi:quercetin dioxygenase-like cupin family protein
MNSHSIPHSIRVLAACSLVLFLQTACSTSPTHDESNKASVAVKELVKSTQSWDGETLPAYPVGQPRVTILRITIPAGVELDLHKHPVINAGVLIGGQLTVLTKSGKTLHLTAGDPIVEVVNTAHFGINQGSVPAEIIVFYAGSVDLPISVIEPK